MLLALSSRVIDQKLQNEEKHMNLRIATLAAALALFAGSAAAQTAVNPNRSADVLNARVLEVLRQNQAAPVPVAAAPVTPAPAVVQVDSGAPLRYYGGIALGSSFQNHSPITAGALVGTQITPNFGLELTFDTNFRDNTNNGYLLMTNVVYQRAIPNTPIRPYALAGIGMGMGNYVARPNQEITAMWNLGAGVRVPFNERWEADVRYRYVAPFNTQNFGVSSNIVTAGLNYRW